ncbi:uncharacterized protein LOC144143133 [Haemaphysalis longicornis]
MDDSPTGSPQPKRKAKKSTPTSSSQPAHSDSKTYVDEDMLGQFGEDLSGDPQDLGNVDGVNMWSTLIADSVSPRTEILLNIDPIWNVSAMRYQGYKLIQGSTHRGRYDGWYRAGEPGTAPANTNTLRSQFLNAPMSFNPKCAAARTIRAMARLMPTQQQEELYVTCGHNNGTSCQASWGYCLFNIDTDPCERDNIAREHPDVTLEPSS